MARISKSRIDKRWSTLRRVLRKSREWGSDEELMYVVGATKAQALSNIRKIVPEHFLLVPGIGVQGGSLQRYPNMG